MLPTTVAGLGFAAGQETQFPGREGQAGTPQVADSVTESWDLLKVQIYIGRGELHVWCLYIFFVHMIDNI